MPAYVLYGLNILTYPLVHGAAAAAVLVAAPAQESVPSMVWSTHCAPNTTRFVCMIEVFHRAYLAVVLRCANVRVKSVPCCVYCHCCTALQRAYLAVVLYVETFTVMLCMA